jgi:FkbM family methyltransferase
MAAPLQSKAVGTATMPRSGVVNMGRFVRALRSATRRLQPAASPPAAEGLAADLQRLFPDGVDTVFDVGAYVGEFAALVHNLFPTARVWCFEPFPESYERIRKQFADADWLVAHNVGLSERSGTAELIVGPDRKTNSLVSPVITNGKFEADLPRMAVPLETLSGCAGELLRPGDRLSIVKIDTEGNDLRVLRGGEDLLRDGSIEALHVEVMFIEHFKGAPGFVEISSYLQQFGYRLFSLYDLKRNAQGQLRFGNALFLSPHRQPFAGVAR